MAIWKFQKLILEENNGWPFKHFPQTVPIDDALKTQNVKELLFTMFG
jgi:hypothetical protein